MTNPSHFKSGADATERAAQGHKRMKEIAAETRERVAAISEVMVRGLQERLGRPATPLEVLQAEAIAGLFYKAHRLREAGRNDLEVLREAVLLQNSTLFRPPQAIPVDDAV
jgi:hypothetical protein